MRTRRSATRPSRVTISSLQGRRRAIPLPVRRGLLVLRLCDKLRDTRSRTHRLYQDDHVRIQNHAVRRVPLLAAFDQNVRYSLRLRILSALHVEHVAKHRVRRSQTSQLSEIRGAIRQQHGLIRRGQGNCLVARIPPGASTQKKNYYECNDTDLNESDRIGRFFFHNRISYTFKWLFRHNFALATAPGDSTADEHRAEQH